MHAVSLVKIDENNILVTWYGGLQEHDPSVNIYLAKLNINNNKYKYIYEKKVVTIKKTQQSEYRYIHSLGNPVITKSNNKIILFFSSIFGGWATSSLNYIISSDSGETWSKPKQLVTSPLFNISINLKGPPILLNNNQIALPAYHELGDKNGLLLILNKNLRIINYKRISWLASLLQPIITPLSENTAKIFFRKINEPPHKLYYNTLSLNPIQISKPITGELSNYDAAVSAVAIDKSHILLAYNPDSKRHILRLAISKDAGKNWCELKDITNSPESSFHSYPYLIRFNKNQYILGASSNNGTKLFTFNQKWIDSQKCK